DTYRIGILLVLAHRTAPTVELGQYAGEILHVVADLVGNDIGLGKVARGAELVAQLVVEGEVNVDLLVVGTVERPARRLCHAAARLRRAGEQHYGRRVVGPVVLAEHFGPEILGFLDDDAHELAEFSLGGIGWWRSTARRTGRRRHAAAGEDVDRVLPGGEPDEAQHHDDTDDAEPASRRTAPTG